MNKVDDSQSSPSLTLISKEELDALAGFARKCQGVLVSCTHQNALLTTAFSEADKQMAAMAVELADEKAVPKFGLSKVLTIVPISLVVGFVLGAILVK